MASVNSPLRTLIKPILFKLLGKKGYMYFQYLAKLKDIKNKLVEEREMVLLPEFVKEGDEVLDIGANYAYYTERLSRLVGRKGKVYAFEPIPFTHTVCRMIIKKLKLNNVSLFEKGVGNRNEKLVFNVPVVGFGGISAGQSHIGSRNNNLEGKEDIYKFDKHESVECEVVRIDDFLADVKNLSFIKIDIEGAEFFALQGMKGMIAQFKPSILIEISPFFIKGFGISVSNLSDFIQKELGYHIYHLDDVEKKLNKVEKDFIESNYILIHHDNISKFSYLINE